MYLTPSVASFPGRRMSAIPSFGQNTSISSTIPVATGSSLAPTAPRDPLVFSTGLYDTPVTDEEKINQKIEEKKRQLKKLDDGFDSKKILEFIVNFANWAKTKRDHDGTIRPFQFFTKYGQAIHEYDFVRTMFYEIDPLHVSEMIEGTVLIQWQTRLGGREEPLGTNSSDHEIWEFLLLNTQYKTISEVNQALSATGNVGKLGDVIYALGQAFVQKLKEFENLELANVKILFGNKPSFRGLSQSRGSSRMHPKNSKGSGKLKHQARQIPPGQWCSICNTNRHAENKCFSVVGCANGVLALIVDSLDTQVFLRIEFQIIPGTNNFLIGRDLLQTLGLRTKHGFNINLDREHRTVLNAECEFDNKICQPIRFIEQLSNKSNLGNDFGHSTFRHDLDELGCRICLDDIRDEERLVVLSKKYKDVFSGLPTPDGIDCQPMTIPFYDVKRKPRRLNPEKQPVAEEIFNELIRNELAVPAKSQFSSPICLVIYHDHRKPRLTGDFSGIGGVNDLTKPVEANLLRISDLLEFLGKANYITTLDLPKAFWQLKIAEEDIDKTTVLIPEMSISFKKACFGLKNVPAVFQNMMMEIFDSKGVFIYIDDVMIVASTLDEFLSRVGMVLERVKRFRINLGLPKCSFTTYKHEIKILGSIFINKTRYINESRIEGLINLFKPRTLPEVRSFISSINYIRDLRHI
ncbi:hypothetical protein P9112_004475 [Eukaryota sp. TZLM1-RC]